MSSILFDARERLQSLLGTGVFDWFDRTYIVDWAVAFIFHVLASVIEAAPVFERGFSLDDPLISHPHAVHQRIDGNVNGTISLFGSFVVVLLFGVMRQSLFEIHQGVLVAFAARGLNDVVTEALKNRVGRLRPDFLSRCNWSDALRACTGDPMNIRDGRRSFPSGHSSTAFVGMTFIVLFLAGKTGALCFSSPTPSRSFLGSRLARLVVTLAPWAFSTWVAISRIEDYRHHKEDVLVGSTIGILSATITYLTFWPNPFSAKSFQPDHRGSPRAIYQDHEFHRPTRRGYELHTPDADTEPV
ncbi:lipid phosphate phosphatase 1 [Amylostereum chailletii]|nr:lipid phosphate phosphatase 1 [Amylostereum chailletii]